MQLGAVLEGLRHERRQGQDAAEHTPIVSIIIIIIIIIIIVIIIISCLTWTKIKDYN